jgi:hypothetical protein
MGQLVEHELVKTVDGRYIKVHQGLQLTEEEVRASVEADRKRADKSESLLSAGQPQPAPALPQPVSVPQAPPQTPIQPIQAQQMPPQGQPIGPVGTPIPQIH